MSKFDIQLFGSYDDDKIVRGAPMGQMNVSLTDPLAKYVQARVKSGRYSSASEVVREALRRMQQDDERAARLAQPTAEDVLTDLTAIQVEAIRRRVLQGIAEIEHGEYTEYEGGEGLRRLAAEIKAEGRRVLLDAARARK